MPRQSTRTKYKSRRERNQEAFRKFRIIFWFALLIGAILILKDWREYWAYLKTFFMD
ncbi:MAG: hypothetical protein AAF828_02460 [Bacteroidota bacterium]